MIQSQRNWTILGAGAVGHLIACHFAKMKIPATLISHTKIPDKHARVTYRADNHLQHYRLIYQSLSNCPPINNLLLTVKSHQVESAIIGIKTSLTPSSRIFLLQNGMGTLEKVTDVLATSIKPSQIFPGSNTHGVYIRKDSNGILQVVHAGIGNMVFGNNYLCKESREKPDCFSSLMQLSLGISWSTNIERKLWLKLAVNAAINPLTAINDCLNGALLDSDSLKQQLKQLCLESANLFKAIDINISKDELINETFAVIGKTSANQSSMLQDVRAGKNTEIAAITGYLLEKARENDITLKMHQMIYHTINSRFDSKLTK